MENRRMFDEIISEKLDRIAADIKKLNNSCIAIHKEIYGNGKSKGSVTDRLARIETTVGIHWMILLLVTGSIIKMAFF